MQKKYNTLNVAIIKYIYNYYTNASIMLIAF